MLTIKSIITFGDRAEQLVKNLISAVADNTDAILAQTEAQTAALKALTEVLGQPAPNVIFFVAGQSIHIPGLQQGEDMSYTVPRDQPDEPFTLDPITASDSEGPVEAVFTDRLESSNPDAVSIVDSSFHFGTNGGAVVSRIVTFEGADFVLPNPVVFNVTPGAITFSGGGINVPGLTPDPEP